MTALNHRMFPADEARSDKIPLLSMNIDAMRLAEAAASVLAVCREERSLACPYVVTPNVDHAVMLSRMPEFKAAYDAARFVFADGLPIVWISKLLGRALPERVAGSDLVPAVFELATQQAGPPLRVFLLGAADGVADKAAANITSRWSGIEIVGTHAPRPGFEHDPQQSAEIVRLVTDAAPDLLLVGLGAPKQELWTHRHAAELSAGIAICGGATIDFLAGVKRRSPVWMRRVGLEWCHRLATEPRRLLGRYATDAWVFPQLVVREWAGR